MKLSKGQGISLFTAIVAFAIFNIVVFVAPLVHSVNFWLGYFFELFALITMVLTLVLYFGKSVKEDKFLSLPAVKVAWIYFVVQTALSVWEMIAFPLSYIPTLIINLILGVVFATAILALYAASGKIDKSEQFTQGKVIFIKQLKLDLDSLETDNDELSKKIKELSENVRYSDPMSHSMLQSIEESLCDTIGELADNITDTDKALELCNKATRLLKKRNEQCKMYKGVKDTVAAVKQKSDNGKSVALAGVCVALAMFLVALAVCFFVVPQTKYNEAKTLFELKKYDEAIVAFENLGDFKDSEQQVELVKDAVWQEYYDKAMALKNDGQHDEAIVVLAEIKDFEDREEKIKEAQDAINQIKYDVAVALIDDGKHKEAIVVLKEIEDYKDSADKMTEAKETIKQNKYDKAESYYNSGKYAKAIDIYTSLGDYKDSKLRVEQIYNRLSDGDIIYFGTYNKKPIAWKIMKTESDKMLLMTEKPIAQKPFHDEIKKVTWETSSLRTWLNEEFVGSFSEDQQNQIIATNTGKEKDKVFLFSIDEMDELSYTKTFKTTDEWWTRTSIDDGIMYASPSGWVTAEGDQVVRDKGVRPSIWISLK